MNDGRLGRKYFAIAQKILISKFGILPPQGSQKYNFEILFLQKNQCINSSMEKGKKLQSLGDEQNDEI